MCYLRITVICPWLMTFISSSSPPVLAAVIWPLVLFQFILSTVHLAFIEAVIIILKHATPLRLSKLSPTSALTQVELEYREANIDSKIRQHLTASSSQEHFVELHASFIMAIDMVRLFLHLLR
ncbi:hypothetical protein EDB85DRAFT_327348 [Lactarius pseudohatsudake]|nr:hypothetical protein EDB85DRAFT_327348 [Lactarius pseudohatsudake]